jgi:DNA-binding MarR family transcriptional regulator
LTDQTPPDSVLIETMPILLRALRSLTTEADQLLERRGLGRAHFRALGAIALEPGATVGEVITMLGITIQAINRVMTALQKRKLIRTESDPGDGRRRKLFLTAEGRRIFDEAMGAQITVLRDALEVCGPAGFESFRAFLLAIADRVAPGTDGEG